MCVCVNIMWTCMKKLKGDMINTFTFNTFVYDDDGEN